MVTADQSLKSLVQELIDDVSRLFRQEFRLARAEMSEKVSQAQNGVFAIIAGLLLAFAALLVLLQALIVALANVLPPWLASVAVGVVVAIVAFILIRSGQSNLKMSVVPERTLHSVRQDKNMVAEKM